MAIDRCPFRNIRTIVIIVQVIGDAKKTNNCYNE